MYVFGWKKGIGHIYIFFFFLSFKSFISRRMVKSLLGTFWMTHVAVAQSQTQIVKREAAGMSATGVGWILRVSRRVQRWRRSGWYVKMISYTYSDHGLLIITNLPIVSGFVFFV